MMLRNVDSLLLCAVLSSSACGGVATPGTSDDAGVTSGVGGGNQATGGNAGSGGNSTGTSGATGTGGSNNGTSGATGTGGSGASGASGAGGNAGSGGDVAPLCKLPKVSGSCDAYVPSYWHNPKTGVCEPFIYGGCAGNENRFASLEACQATCRGGAVDLDACVDQGDCQLLSTSCCASCGDGDARSFVAVARDDVNKYQQIASNCGDTCGCACAPCQVFPEKELTAQYYAADCRAGSCVVVDVRETAATSCVRDEDCYLRNGLSCCEECDGQGFVALSHLASEVKLICGNGLLHGCPPCVSQTPTNKAACQANHCAVVVGP